MPTKRIIEGKINILSQSEYPFVFLSTSFISRSILVPILQQMRRHNFSFHQYSRCLSHRWIINSIKSIYVLRTTNIESRNFESYAMGQYAKYQRNNNRQTRDSPVNRVNSKMLSGSSIYKQSLYFCNFSTS